MAETVNAGDRIWLKQYDSGIPEKIDYIRKCVPEFLDRAAEDFPDCMGLSFQGYEMTFSEMNDMVNRFANRIIEAGIGQGDRVAILLPNCIPCVIAYYAVLRAGAIVVMNNPLYSDRELKHQFNDSGSVMLVTLDLLADRMIKLREETGIRSIIYTSIGDYLPFPKSLLFPLVGVKKGLAAQVMKAPSVIKWKDFIKGASAENPGVDVSVDDDAMYQYTGGTTGISKGAVLTHMNVSAQVQQVASWFPGLERGTEIMMGALPYFHVFGMSTSMNLAVIMGWGNVLVPKPQPEPLIQAIEKYRVTFAPMVPTMYIGMLGHPRIEKADLSCITGCFSGSAPLPVEVIRDFEKKTGSLIVEGFGLTESSPVTHINPFVKGKTKPGTIGLPLPDTECRIVDIADGSTDVPPGERGELLIRGPQVMKGYLNMPDETEKTIRNGWLHTGDIAVMDSQGYFSIVDRKKDIVISGGYNIYPRDIDEIMYENDKVREACSIGVPHPKRGEAVKTFIVLKQGFTATQEEFIEFCRGKLASYKLPSEIEFRDELPKTTVGKILRTELRQEELRRRTQAVH